RIKSKVKQKSPGTAYDDPVLGKDPQAGHMKDIYTGTKDNGEVRINSGIPNRAFYPAAKQIGGYAWKKTGQIWYVILCDKLDSKANIKGLAEVTIAVAGDLYGSKSSEQQAVENAWREVGLE
ncbi:MAG: M4 family metallopeptidase, partial [Cyanobacteria bacterium J06649_11]